MKKDSGSKKSAESIKFPLKIGGTQYIPQHLIKAKAFAIFRFNDRDVYLKHTETTLGRSNTDINEENHIEMSESKKISRIACKVALNKKTDIF